MSLVFKSKAAKGLGECIHFTKHKSSLQSAGIDQTIKILRENENTVRANTEMHSRTVTENMTISFARLWGADDGQLLAFANEHGLIVEKVDPIL